MPDTGDDQNHSTDKPETPPTKSGKPGNPGGGGGLPGGDGNMRFSRSMLGWILILSIAVLIFVVFHRDQSSPKEAMYSEFHTQLEQHRIQSIILKDDGTLIATLKPNPVNESTSPPGTQQLITHVPGTAMDGYLWNLLSKEAEKYDAQFDSKTTNNVFFSIVISFLPYLLIFLVIWFFFLRQIRSGGGGIGMLGNFGRSRHRLLSKEHTNVTFNDVAGIEEAKEELTEIVEFLKNPKRFQRLGGRIPRGVLLIGDPGVGKTLLAKAIAGEADVPFFSISGSDFVEMFVGVGASRVRDLFKTAKESSPCIIFLDEIDAVGRRRGNGMASGGHDEREQTLNAILVEMDGFDTNDQVIVIAATNRSDVLDPALTRPGRFDRQVFVPLPDIKGRYEILKVHARKVKLGSNVDLMRLARQTPDVLRCRSRRDHQRSRTHGHDGQQRRNRDGRS